MDVDEALRLLGLDAPISVEAIKSARRKVALDVHPDVGGSDESMARVNRAVDVLLDHLGSRPPEPRIERRSQTSGAFVVDRPSFVIDALPAEAFEWLLLAARVLGEIVDDDPPYGLEVLLDSRPDRWCRLELVPDAGSSTVSILAENADADDLVRLWVSTVNELGSD